MLRKLSSLAVAAVLAIGFVANIVAISSPSDSAFEASQPVTLTTENNKSEEGPG